MTQVGRYASLLILRDHERSETDKERMRSLTKTMAVPGPRLRSRKKRKEEGGFEGDFEGGGREESSKLK